MNVENSYASKALGGSALGLAIGGLATSLLGGNIGNILGGCSNGCSENTPVNRYEMGLQQQLAASESENALLKSNIYTDGKLVEVYANLEGQIKELAGEVRANKDAQCAINMEQAVYNGTNTATINCLRGQVYDLLGLTKRVVPNTSVCPGWGDVTVTPATTTATGA